MQTILKVACVACSLLVANGYARAELMDRGGGLIYDTVLNVTWLQNANPAKGTIYDDGVRPNDGLLTFDSAKTWAENLEYYDPIRGVTYSDWRLPRGYDMGAPGGPPGLLPTDGVGCDWKFYGSDCGYNQNPNYSELVHLYYVTLGNLAQFDTNGTQRPGQVGIDWGLVNKGPFTNFVHQVYWSHIANPFEPTLEWRHFKFVNGRTSWRLDEPNNRAWAVRDGDVAAIPSAVPEPETYALLLAGLGLLGFSARRRRATTSHQSN